MSDGRTTPASRAGPPPDVAAVAAAAQQPQQRLRAAAQQRLRNSDYAALRDILCETQTGTVILRGRVSSFYFKQLAQELVRKADGAFQIVNELEVEDGSRSDANGQANGKSHVHLTETLGRAEETHGCADLDCG